jgi:hypothetical protein
MNIPFCNIYPLTIIKDRYNGIYSGGGYLAFNIEHTEIPNDVSSNDSVCSDFWDIEQRGLLTLQIGKGRTPNDAVDDLFLKLQK